MSKSQYPNKLDTSAEIQHVRDNITEIGSDVINSIRSAIFQIEKTLGTNPQGSVGNTVSNRIDRSLDDRGNLKKEALDRVNVLSGPIIDSDVSKVAAIREFKLKLDFPTQLLQDEISILNNQIDSIIEKVDELNLILSIHVSPEATNRHKAKAITVEDNTVASPSPIATTSFDEQDLQSFINVLYDSHINYTGDIISSTNRSHEADQIFFDNINVSDIIKSESVQGAIEDMADLEGVALRDNTLNLNSNGLIRSGSVFDAYEGNDLGSVIVDSSSVNHEALTGKSTTKFFFEDKPTPLEGISEFDLLTVSGSSVDDDNKSYLIKDFSLTSDGLVYVEVYGAPTSETEDGVFAVVSKNIYRSYNQNGLNCTVRYRKDHTNTPDIQVANPDSATIISRGVNPAEITSANGSFKIEIDGKDAVDIDTYDSNYVFQSIDTIVSKINKYSINNHLNIMAYKIRTVRCYEIAIAHNMPNYSGDVVNRTLKISEGDSDGTDSLGLTHILDKEFEGRAGNAYHINGLLLSNFGRVKSYTSSEVQISTDLTINVQSDLDFISEKIRTGDLAVITGSSDGDDDGTYRILEVSNGIIMLDHSGGSFSGELEGNSAVFIIRCCAPVHEMDFEEIGPITMGPLPTVGCVLFDVFLTEEKDVLFRRRLEQSGIMASSGFKASIVDVSNNFIESGQVATISIDTSSFASMSGPGVAGSGPSIKVASSGRYKLFSADRMSYIIIQVQRVSSPSSTLSVDIYGFDEFRYNGLRLCRGTFATSVGRVFSTSSVSSENRFGVPVLIDKRATGTADDTIIGESFIEKYIQGPRNELRGSGIIRGCKVTTSSIVSSSDDEGDIIYFTVTAGIAVVNGIRYEFPGVEDYGQRVANGVFYVAIDSSGCLITGYESSGESPFSDTEVAHLARIKISSTTGMVISNFDLRLFVDNLDYKLIADITVSNDQRFSHFTSIKHAVEYARMFSRIFPDFGATPSVLIKEGVYTISESIIVNKDIMIRGVGPQTVIKRADSFRTGSTLSDINEFIPNAYKSLFIIGGADEPELGTWKTKNSSGIHRGVTFRDFTYIAGGDFASDTIASVFTISQKRNGNFSTEKFRFENISFKGPNNAENNSNGGQFEWAITLSRQTVGNSSSAMGLVLNGDGTYREFTGLMVSGCSFHNMGCGVKIVCTGGMLFNSVFSNNIVTLLPTVSGVLTPSEFIDAPDWRTSRTGHKNPYDWFFKMVGVGNGWRGKIPQDDWTDERVAGNNDNQFLKAGFAVIGTIINNA